MAKSQRKPSRPAQPARSERFAGRVATYQRQLDECTENDRLELHRLDHAVGKFRVAEMLWHSGFNDADRAKLGGDLVVAHDTLGTVGMWCEARGVGFVQGLLLLAERYCAASQSRLDHLAKQVGEHFSDDDSPESLAKTGKLVVITGEPFTVYWNGKEAVVDWDRQPSLRDYFQLLCEHSKAGVPLSNFDLPARAGLRGLIHRASRLRKLEGFPPDLLAAINFTRAHGHQLMLEPDDIRIFSRSPSRLTEMVS